MRYRETVWDKGGGVQNFRIFCRRHLLCSLVSPTRNLHLFVLRDDRIVRSALFLKSTTSFERNSLICIRARHRYFTLKSFSFLPDSFYLYTFPNLLNWSSCLRVPNIIIQSVPHGFSFPRLPNQSVSSSKSEI